MTQTVDEYIASLAANDSEIFEHMAKAVKRICPTTEQSISYGMPCFMYHKHSLISFIVRKKHYSLYPFSGKVIDSLQDDLKGFAITTGSIHFTAENMIDEALLKKIVKGRMYEIDSKLSTTK